MGLLTLPAMEQVQAAHPTANWLLTGLHGLDSDEVGDWKQPTPEVEQRQACSLRDPFPPSGQCGSAAYSGPPLTWLPTSKIQASQSTLTSQGTTLRLDSGETFTAGTHGHAPPTTRIKWPLGFFFEKQIPVRSSGIARRLGIQGWLQLQSKFEANLAW